MSEIVVEGLIDEIKKLRTQLAEAQKEIERLKAENTTALETLRKAGEVINERIDKIVLGALKSTINAHTQIGNYNISSLHKRIINQIHADESLSALTREIEENLK